MLRKIRLTGVMLIIAAIGLPGWGARPASAAPTGQMSGTVMATGLASPRGIAVGDDGNVYVAESGSGGDQVVKVGEGDEATELRLGNTGQIRRIAPDGSKTILASGLPSAGSLEGEAAGPAGIIYENGALWVTTAGTTPGLTPRPNEGSVLRIDPQSGAIQPVANVQSYEMANNPDGFAIDSNLYGLALGQDGKLYVADAGGNTLYRVDPGTGALNVVTVFGGLPVPEPLKQGPFAQGNPERNGAMEIDPVPTGVSIAEDGDIYVGLLSGFPFLEGGTRVLHVTSEGDVHTQASGLTMVTDVEASPDGSVYVSEFGQFDLTSQPPGFKPNSGRVLRVLTNGTKQVVAEGLNATNGLALDASGNLYAVVNSVSATDGQVLRFSNVTNVMVGMPRTGQGFSMEQAVYLSLLLILGGCALVLAPDKFMVRRRDVH